MACTGLARFEHMATHVSHAPVSAPPRVREATGAELLVPVGRVFYALMFILSSMGHFTTGVIAYGASMGVPAPNLLVPLSGVIALVGALMVAFGFRTRIGAALIVVFLVPVTLWMHRFWLVADPMMRALQHAAFFKNVSMLGCALLLMYWGGGPFSFDGRRR